MRILITGGAGFIGGHIADSLVAQGDSIAVVDDLSSGEISNIPAQADFFEIDITDAKAVKQAIANFRPDAICHQAAQMSVSRSVREPDFDASVNIMGLVHVLQAAAENGVEQVVFASSGGVLYGDVSEPAPEMTPPNPISPYGISKWAGEKYLAFFAREHQMSTVALRYSNVYGPRQNPHGEAGVVAIFCTKMLNGEAATVNGDGKYIRDYVYVSDVVDANLKALRSPTDGFRAFNVGTGIPTDVNELAEAIRNCCQQELNARHIRTTIPEVNYGPARAGDLRSNLIAYDKIHQELGWSPQTTVEDGIKQTASWFAVQQFDSERA